MKMRYDLGIDVFHTGPYMPGCEDSNCTACGICMEKCPVNTISESSAVQVIDLERCLGCGICAEICPSQCITMEKSPGRIRQDSEPGYIRLLLSVGYVYLFMAPALIAFRLLTGSKRDLSHNALPRESDR